MKVVAIIPAYNEEKTIADVIKVIKESDIIDRIIAVNDGSTDHTFEILMSMGIEVIDIEKNIGKGGAMKAGIDKCIEDVILFLDADLLGLKKEHIKDLLVPIISGEADMCVGIFSKGRYLTDFAQKLAPFLSGQRAVKRYLMVSIPNMDKMRYGVETAMTRLFYKKNIRMKTIELNALTHYMKEEKLGLIKGFKARLHMYYEIIRYLIIFKVGNLSSAKVESSNDGATLKQQL